METGYCVCVRIPSTSRPPSLLPLVLLTYSLLPHSSTSLSIPSLISHTLQPLSIPSLISHTLPTLFPHSSTLTVTTFSFTQPELMFALAQTLANTSNNAVVRQAAGVYLKNCLFSKEENAKLQFRERWLLIDASARDQIKDLVH